jgi:hypothetical protein
MFFGHATLVVRDGQPFFGLHQLSAVMPGLVPGIHVFRSNKQDVDCRDKPGHDVGEAHHERKSALR